MDNWLKWIVSIVGGALAAFFQQYGLFIALVAVAVVLDVITGIVKAKATGEGLSSKRATQGFWKKISLFVGLFFGIFLDYAALTVFAEAGVNISVKMPFALIIACYIVLNECISIAENLVLINPEIMPKWVSKLLKVAKEDIDKKND